MNKNNELYPWSVESLLEITLEEPDDFLKIKETLTRIGVASTQDNTLYQSCHILHKRGKYYIVMFKELFKIDGRTANITYEDVARRNTIASLLDQWKLCSVVPNMDYIEQRAPVGDIKIIAHKDKRNWKFEPKYQMRSERTPR